jgi:hypothetical protein
MSVLTGGTPDQAILASFDPLEVESLDGLFEPDESLSELDESLFELDDSLFELDDSLAELESFDFDFDDVRLSVL